MLVCLDHGAVAIVCIPIKLAPSICLGLAGMQDMLPGAGLGPALEAGGDGGPWSKAHGQVAPVRSIHNIPIHDAAMVFRRSATLAALGWSLLRKQGL
jgi:hypothetical protein